MKDSAPPHQRRSLTARLAIGFFKLLLFTPLYLVAGLLAFAAGVGIHYLDETADLDLAQVERLEAGARVVDAHGLPVGRIGSMNRIFIRREDIPPNFVDALIAAEDQRYFAHPGFDPIGTIRAAWANYRAETIREGASTLTQQLARDVYGLTGRDAERKLLEIATAVRMERHYTKDEILVHYLNRIYFGSGFYGLGAAAKGYFAKGADQLTADESAMLCGLIRSPSRISPLVNRRRAVESRNHTLRRMAAIGRLSPEELERHLSAETPTASSREEQIARGQASFLLARTERELRSLGLAESLEGGSVRIAADLAAQQEAALFLERQLESVRTRAVESGADADALSDLQGALLVVENLTGRILLAVGSRDFFRSEYDRSLDMKRPPGSAFLPFLYAAAFESGRYAPDSPVLDAPFDNGGIGLGAVGGVLGEWSTENPENLWEGFIPAIEALRRSKNSPAARIGTEIGLDAVRAAAQAAGIESELLDQPGSLLGASEANLTELTRAYTAFANLGLPAPQPHLVVEVADAAGRPVRLPAARGDAAGLTPATAAAISEALREEGSAEAGGRHGKSGTTPAFTDAWHFGFDEHRTWGVWIGRDTYRPIHRLSFGGETAGPVAARLAGLFADAEPSLAGATEEAPSLAGAPEEGPAAPRNIVPPGYPDPAGGAGTEPPGSRPGAAPLRAIPLESLPPRIPTRPGAPPLIGADPFGTLGGGPPPAAPQQRPRRASGSALSASREDG